MALSKAYSCVVYNDLPCLSLEIIALLTDSTVKSSCGHRDVPVTDTVNSSESLLWLTLAPLSLTSISFFVHQAGCESSLYEVMLKENTEKSFGKSAWLVGTWWLWSEQNATRRFDANSFASALYCLMLCRIILHLLLVSSALVFLLFVFG